MEKFNCKFCGYSTEASEKPDKCPYCNKKDAMIREENAEELVSNA
jgi:rubrerythrin